MLNQLNIDENTKLLDNLDISPKFKKTLSVLESTMYNLRTSVYAEKEKVLNVLQYFFKKKTDAEGVFEYVFEETKHTDTLGVSDVTILLSSLSSIKEAFSMLRVLLNYIDLFDKSAQEMIDEEMKNYSKILAQTDREASFASIDVLTGVPNKRMFQKDLQMLLKTPERTVSMIALDIDFFKAVNEVFGHKGGDVVLRRVARMVNSLLRKKQDTLYRLGGEEFTIVMNDTDQDQASKVCERLRREIEQMDIPPMPVDNETHFREFWEEGKFRVIRDDEILVYDRSAGAVKKYDRKSLRETGRIDTPIEPLKEERVWITISFGIATYPLNSSNLLELQETADSALNRAKDQGRNRVIVSNRKAA